MRLHNTLTRQVDDLRPISPPTVTIYTCGPTVYDYAHIGHWFTYVRWDTLIRTLKASGLQPKWVMNITDVGHLVSDADDGEDKLEKGAKREGKTAWEVAKFYTDDFVQGMQALNMLAPDHMPKATEHIAEQIDLITKLEELGLTYTISDGVYYDTSKFPRYADFAKLDLEEQQAGARVQLNPEKRNATDFALWKFSPTGQQRDMEWDSPWGKGFPGWHIECSAMSMKYLGDTLDIHTGGIDHIPVHHTNEIAQSEPVTGKPFANIWLHSNHVLINDEKISKSLGNGIRWQQLEERGYSPLVLRLHILESHYRSQSKFSWESLEAAKNRLKTYERMADLQFQSVETDVWFAADQSLGSMLQAMQDDLNTPQALAALSALAGRAEEQLISSAESERFRQVLHGIDELLGLTLATRTDITDTQKALIIDREAARSSKNWAKSDELRDELTKQGIGIRDTEHGPIWYRI
jgi:cysteinyl-tRNA synthetase